MRSEKKVGERKRIATERQQVDAELERRVAELVKANAQLKQEIAGREAGEKRQSVSELRAREEFNQAVLNALNAHIAVLDRDGVIVAVNEAWRRFARGNSDAEGIAAHTDMGTNYLAVCQHAAHDADTGAQQTFAGIKAVLDGSQPGFTLEYPCHSPTEERWFLLDVNPLPPERGGGAVVSHIDITARKQAEERLRQSEAQSRTLADSIPQLAWMAEADGFIFWYNRRWYDYTGTSLEEMQGWGWQSVHDPHEVERVTEGFKRALLSGEPWEDTFPLRRHDGEFRRFLSRALPIRDADGRIVRWFGTNTDVEEQLRIEEQLKASESRYRALTDAMPQLVWATDANGSHFYYNRQWYEFTGLSEEESMGFGFANALHPEDKERTLQRWQRAWRDGEPYEIEYRFYSRPKGVYRWFLARAVPVRDETGNITQWVGTCTDIEEQKHMEVTLARINREREQLLQEVSTPIVPVWRGVLALPIIGSLDSWRMQQATETALNAVAKTGARACIIDITGARIVDSHAVANLSSLVAALKLVGAEAIVTGVTAHVAQSLVGLGLDFTGMRTHRTLAEALSSVITTSMLTQRNNYERQKV